MVQCSLDLENYIAYWNWYPHPHRCPAVVGHQQEHSLGHRAWLLWLVLRHLLPSGLRSIMERPEFPPSREIREHAEPTCPTRPHTHVAPDGSLVKCYHACKSVVASPAFWIGTTISFPFEHYLYEKVWPFTILTDFLGL